MAFFDGLGSALVGGFLGLAGGRDQNSAAQANSQAQMDFQERMSSTAHQREVADLRAAGLNPILSGTGGAGSSTPAGSAAPVVSALGQGVSSAVATRYWDLQQEKLETEIRNINADTDVKNTNVLLTDQLIEKALYETQVTANSTAKSAHEVDLAKHLAAKAAAEVFNARDSGAKIRAETTKDISAAALNRSLKHKTDWDASTAKSTSAIQASKTWAAKAEAEIDQTLYGRAMRYLDRFIRSLTGTANSARDVNAVIQSNK